MTEFSTDWAGVHGAGMLGMSGSGPLTEGTHVLRAMGAYMVQGLALEASYNGGIGWWFRSVGDNDGVVAGSRLHNHLQSSGERNMSRAHSRSTLSANPSPSSLSWHSIATISFSWGKARRGSWVMREGVSSSGQLGGRVNSGVS